MQDIALFIDSSTGASLPDYIIGEEQISVPLLLFFYVCIFPLLFLRKISMLKYSGFVVVALTVFMTICVVIYAGAGADYVESNGCTLKLDPLNGSAPVVGIVPRTSDIVLADIDFSFLNTLSLISTSYILQLSVFPIFSEMLVLRDGVPTASTQTAERKMAAAAAWTTLLASSLYITVGLAGYFTWFNLLNNPLNTNMLYCYDLNEPGWGAVFLVISIGMIFVSSGAFPVVFFALRGGLIRVIMPCFPAAKQAQKTSGHRERRRSSAPSLPELPDKIDGNGSNGIAAHGQQSKSVYELNREVEEEVAAAKYASIENKAWLAVTIGISTITVVLSSLPQVNLKLVLSWGCALFGYPLAFTVS